VSLPIDHVAFHELSPAAAAHPDRLIITNVPDPLSPEDVAALAACLSRRAVTPSDIHVRTVTPDATTTSTALSLDRLNPHTDGAFLPHPPERFLLSCTQPDHGAAGTSIFIPIEIIVGSAPGWAVDAFVTADLRFPKTYDGDLATAHVGPALWRPPDGQLSIRWRADALYQPAVVDAHGTRAADAVTWLHDYTRTGNHHTHTLARGEIALIPNHLLLHGRHVLSPNSTRTIERAWLLD
jgi:hypothetical protein